MGQAHCPINALISIAKSSDKDSPQHDFPTYGRYQGMKRIGTLDDETGDGFCCMLILSAIPRLFPSSRYLTSLSFLSIIIILYGISSMDNSSLFSSMI